MLTLTVIRHSLTIANEQGLLVGSRLDSPLSEKGRELARIKAMSFKKEGFAPEIVYTSKLLRTKQTAETILQELGSHAKIVSVEDLNERDFGKYDGKPIQDLLDGFDKHGPNPPTVETVEHFVKRVMNGLEHIKNEASKSVLIVTHTNPVNVMKAALFNPENLQTYWEESHPEYCEGFTYIS